MYYCMLNMAAEERTRETTNQNHISQAFVKVDYVCWEQNVIVSLSCDSWAELLTIT